MRQRAADGPDAGGSDADVGLGVMVESVLVDIDRLARAVVRIDAQDESLVQRAGAIPLVGVGLMLAGIVALGRAQRRNVAELARRNQVVLDAAGEGILGLDDQGVGVFANPAAATLLGRLDGQLVGMGVHELLHVAADGSEPHPADQCALLESLQGQRVGLLHQDRFVRADGTTFPTEYSASSASDRAAVTRGVLVFRDVTERRAVEKMKDQFISVVSHELRTPLTSIHGSLGLLAGGVLGDMSPPAQRMLDIATMNTDRLVRLVNDILDIERMSSGEIRMDREVVEVVGEVVHRAVESLGGMAEEADVEVGVDAADPVSSWADRDRLTQVLVNLLSNAIKFSPRGGPVTVTVRAEQANVVVSVADRGRGIPEATTARSSRWCAPSWTARATAPSRPPRETRRSPGPASPARCGGARPAHAQDQALAGPARPA